ncbi:UNVERIFIED_CONTAM: putative pre-splicing factor ATP-dependent RNA helicase DEAH9 [Sesamum radiatum]|uniref:RNA helicase n=1 Tax=Sesamum radiatum TaxID=300843 RepID=A0AAW2KFQ9_SESRA
MSRFWKPGTEKPRLVDDEEGGVLFYTASSSSSSGYGHASMEKQRQRLPVFKYRTAILYLVEKHATTIIVGETGSGKTTQIPQGRGFNVEIFYVEEPVSDYIRAAVSTVNAIHDELKALGIDNILGFDWPASPSPEALIRALEVLYSLGILDDDAKLTSPAGFQVAEIPLDPMVSKMILASNDYGCSEEAITIAAVLSIQSIWFSVRGAQKELDEAKLRFAAAEGDHITFLNVYKGFIQSGKSSNWCHKNHINYHSMRKVDEIRQQLRRIAQRIGIALKSCEGDMQVVRKAVTAGFFANACHLESFSHNGLYKTVRGSQEVYIHPSSVLFRVNPKWVVFHSIVSTDRQYMRNVISIDPSWLTDTAPQFYQHQQLNPRPH